MFSKRELFSPVSTALAMLPTPDCSGSRFGGRRPFFTSCSKNSMRWPAIFSEVASGGLKGRFRSGAWVSTIATIFDGSTRKVVWPMRSSGFTSGMGTRLGGRAVP